MAKNISLKNKYNDVLYWATSKQAKGKDYQITRTEEAVLRKLIHYDKSNPKITYSNSIIAEHTFMGEESVKKAIPKLAKKRYISTATYKITDDGAIKTRRTIFVKWDFIETVLGDIPEVGIEQEEIEVLPILEEEVELDLNSEESQSSTETPIVEELEEVEKEQKEKLEANKVSTVIEDDVSKDFQKKKSKMSLVEYEKKCIAEAQAAKNEPIIITFEYLAKDYEIDEEISEILTPIYDLKPFMTNDKLKLNFNGGKEPYISINSDDEEIKLPNIRNAYYPELFIIPFNTGHLEYKKDRKPNKYLIELENNIDSEADPNGSSTIDNDDDNDNEGDDLPW